MGGKNGIIQYIKTHWIMHDFGPLQTHLCPNKFGCKLFARLAQHSLVDFVLMEVKEFKRGEFKMTSRYKILNEIVTKPL